MNKLFLFTVLLSLLFPVSLMFAVASGDNSNGGGSFASSAKVSFTCAGNAGTMDITVFDNAVKSATVDIIYLGGSRNEKVFTQVVNGTTNISFTPGKAGDYELHVSVGSDQTNADFHVPSCGVQAANITQNVTVRLAPERELIFTKLVIPRAVLA